MAQFKPSGVFGGRRCAVVQRGPGASCRPDQDRLWHVAHRPARRQRQNVAGRHAGLGRRHQFHGRPARPAGQARFLRRSKQSVAGPGHLLQAARYRQSRPDRQRLRLDPDRRGNAGRDRAEENVLQPVRYRRQRDLQLSEVFFDDPQRPDAEAGFHARLLQGGRSAEAETADHRDRDGGRRVRTQRLRGRRGKRQGLRLQDRLQQALSASTRPTSRRSCGPCRRSIPTCS